MKMRSAGIWAHRKTVAIFLLGIALPSILVGFLSWNAFTRRREALRKVIESQLWISGESFVKSLENALLEYEEHVLNSELFAGVFDFDEGRLVAREASSLAHEKVFLIDADFRLVFPETNHDTIPYARWVEGVSDSLFAVQFQRAEHLEYSERSYLQAAELYRRCSLATPVPQLRAYALERLACCLVYSERFDEALTVYRRLLDEFGELRTRVGHPYALVAVLRMNEIVPSVSDPSGILDHLIDVLHRMRNGEWTLKHSAYDFYANALQDILQKASSGRHPELRDAFEAIQKSPSPYLQELEFEDMLKESVVPQVKERVTFSRYINESQKGRFPVPMGDSLALVSYARLGDVASDRFFYAGFCWDLAYTKEQVIPDMLNTIAQATGIEAWIIDEDLPPGETNGAAAVIPERSLSVSLRQFPFPWRFIITQSSLENLRSAAVRENWTLGVLLLAVVCLMFLGALLLARDIARESATTMLKTEFVHNISHELKAPLTLIRLYGETLKDRKQLPQETREDAYDVITRESERLSHMINNVLDFSRMETGKKEFNLRPGDLAASIRDTLKSYRHHLEDKGFTIRENIEAGLPEIPFDKEAQASVLINLLSNAAKFSPEEKDVTITLKKAGECAVLQVADKGMGISRHEMDKIFQRFYRSRERSVSETTGSGLGLTIIRHIMEAHGGKVEVQSEPGKGSVFSAAFPIKGPEKQSK